MSQLTEKQPPAGTEPDEPAHGNTRILSVTGRLAPGLSAAGVLAAALALAAGIQAIQAGRPPERAVLLTGVLLAALLFAAPLAYTLRRGLDSRPGTAGLVFLSGCAIALLGTYFFWVSSYVLFPADILIWSEGDFVNDILKFTIGYPIYSPQVNNDSINYVPGAQLLTYLLAWTVGKAGSIPAYRVIQLGFAAVGAWIASLCCRRMLRLAFPGLGAAKSWLWNILWFSVLLLVATNSTTNHFAHNLHADSLAEVVNVTAFYLLLCYIDTRSLRVLAAMAILVTAGFFVRQNALLWGVCYGGFLAVWGGSWKRLAAYAAGAAALFAAAVAACLALWGEPFYYWVFYMVTRHPISPLRSALHGLQAWTYFAALVLGAAAVLRGRRQSPLLGAWLICLLVLASETYTSGLGWTLNHMGPGSLLAAIWFFAGLASVWELATESDTAPAAQNWLRAGALAVTVALLFNGLGFIRIPQQQLSQDAYRYVHDIEKEFQGVPANRVLLDLGTWVYWKDRVEVGDRSPSIGARGYAQAGDFSGILARINSKRYSKILVHGFHSFDFVYDYFLFPKPTGIRQALLDNYQETGKIRGADGPPDVKDWAEDPYYFGEITILTPKPNSPAGQ